MKSFLIIYSEVRNNQNLATFHTIEKHENKAEALETFKKYNECFHYKVLALREIKPNQSIYL